jgi:hypothetical protein
MKMHKAGIVIDPWKLAIFERHLKQAGYTYVNAGLIHKDGLVLRVDTINLEALNGVLQSAQHECKMTGAPK